uniref:Uncharacterized protein n=1 Tax=Opuntia streptacantha TaxID=393608 RepID=A0A7C9DH23_OPUST
MCKEYPWAMSEVQAVAQVGMPLHSPICIKLETLNPSSKASYKCHVLVSMSISRRSLIRITALTIFPFIESKCREFFVEKSIDLSVMSFHLNLRKLNNVSQHINLGKFAFSVSKHINQKSTIVM